ncbi:MAG: OadG family protein [Methylophagaceae bacterium]
MEEYSLLSEGINLMLFGMGFVFVFLTLLVFATKLMSMLITKYEKNVGVIPDEGVPSPATYIPQHGPLIEQLPTTKNSDIAVVSVITAAIHKFRSRK